MNSPYFHFYPNDWLSSLNVSLMSVDQQGAYVRLLCVDWANDGIPDDDEKLAVLTQLGEQWFNGRSTAVRNCFVPHPSKHGYLTNPRLQKEREKLSSWQEQRRLAGRASAKSRQDKALAVQRAFNERSTSVQRNGNGSVESPLNEKPTSHKSDSTKEKKEGTGVQGSGEVTVPSLAEVLEWGKMDGVPEEVCRDFFCYNDGLGWMRGATPIRNPRAWLKRFLVTGARVKPANGSGGGPLWEKKKRLEELEKAIPEHVAYPNGNYSHAATPEERQEFRAMMAEVKKLRFELGKGAEK